MHGAITNVNKSFHVWPSWSIVEIYQEIGIIFVLNLLAQYILKEVSQFEPTNAHNPPSGSSLTTGRWGPQPVGTGVL